MIWWWLTIGGLVLVVCWRLSKPVRVGSLQREDFPLYFEALLVNSKKHAWIRISDRESRDTLLARKANDLGTRMMLDLRIESGKEARVILRDLEDLLATQGAESFEQSVTDRSLTMVVEFSKLRFVKQATELAVAAFDSLGSPPGRRFHLHGKGKPDPEHWRPILRSFMRERVGTRSRRIGEEGLKLLERRRKRKESRDSDNA